MFFTYFGPSLKIKSYLCISIPVRMKKLFIFVILCGLTLSCSQKKSDNSSASSSNSSEEVVAEDEENATEEPSAPGEKKTRVEKQILDLEIGKSTMNDVKAYFKDNTIKSNTYVDGSTRILLFGGDINFLGQVWDEALCVVKNGKLDDLTLTKKTTSPGNIFETISGELRNKYDISKDKGVVVAANNNSVQYWDKETLVSVVKEDKKITYRVTGRK